MIRHKVVMAVMAVMGPLSAHADVPLSDYRYAVQEGGAVYSSMLSYLRGVASGIVYSNTHVLGNGSKATICKSDTVELNDRKIARIIDDQILIDNSKASDPVEGVLFSGLMRTFPCPRP